MICLFHRNGEKSYFGWLTQNSPLNRQYRVGLKVLQANVLDSMLLSLVLIENIYFKSKVKRYPFNDKILKVVYISDQDFNVANRKLHNPTFMPNKP